MIHYPEQVVRIMRPQVHSLQMAIRSHFKRRHTHGAAQVRSWIAEYRRVIKASGYNIALRMIQERSAAK